MLEPFKSGQAEIGVKATHIVPILPKESFGSYWFDDCREAKRRSPSELAVLKLLRIVLVVQSSAIATTAREEAALQRARELEEHNRV